MRAAFEALRTSKEGVQVRINKKRSLLVTLFLYIWIKRYLSGIVKSFNIANRYIVTKILLNIWHRRRNMSIFVPTNYKHRQVMNNKDKEMAAHIAAMYLEKKPRPELYLVNLCSSEDDSQGGYYKKLSEEDKAVIRRWEPDNEDDISLDEFLQSEDPELYDRLIENYSAYPLNMIDSCDLNDMKKYSPCQIHQYTEGQKDR